MAGGDEAALAELHRRYAPYLYGLGRRMLRQQDDVETCVQDAFFNAWKAAGRFDPSRASVKTWLVTIAHNRMLQALRDRPDTGLDLEEWDSPTSAPDRIEQVIAQRAVDILGEPERTLVVLAFYKGYSHTELTEQTGLPLGSIKTYLRRALAQMRLHLETPIAPSATSSSNPSKGGQHDAE
ncbi:RNA polymerase subunit sigma-24 [Deinococcus irradiatisoli]|uniref:RNA polymerase subunit sigma-24 n=2 Tax=Deinococcus irradiatisoli TaxID=2202254 RepID=A0A2Z3JHE3_9DEIO|nr:RNA polymerase subunit sigma-24 [Deinococcus irradiatisoli]